MLQQREWREGFLAERMQDEILQEQILIETEANASGKLTPFRSLNFRVIHALLANLLALAAL